MATPDKEALAAVLEAHKYGREKLQGLYPRNKKLLTQLATSIVPSQYLIDFGNASNFMLMGYRRNPKAKSINNKYFTLLALPKGGGYQSSPLSAMSKVVGDKVAWPTIKSLEGTDIPITDALQIEKEQEMMFRELGQILGGAHSPEAMKKASDVVFDNLNSIYNFLTAVDAAFQDSPDKKARASLQAGVDEINRLLGEAEQKLNDLRITAMKMDADEDDSGSDEEQFPQPDFGEQYEERRQQEEDRELNFDPVHKVFAPSDFDPEERIPFY